MLNRECWHWSSGRLEVLCVGGGRSVWVGEMWWVCVSSEGKKFHVTRKRGQRKKERKDRKKATPSPNKNKISGMYRIVTGR